MIKDKGAVVKWQKNRWPLRREDSAKRRGEDYPSLFKTDIGSYFRGHRQCGNIPYGVSLPRDQVQDMAVRPFAYARIINISIGLKKG